MTPVSRFAAVKRSNPLKSLGLLYAENQRAKIAGPRDGKWVGIRIAQYQTMTLKPFRSFGRNLGKRSFWALGLGIALMAALPGCVAHAEGALVADYPVEYVETAPVRIEYYPRTYYRGHPAYLVEGRWYYRTHDRWAVFREEPVELRSYRTQRGPAYLAPQTRYGRNQERLIVERRADERRAEQHRQAQRRAEEDRRRAHAEAQRAQEHRQTEQRRLEQHREAERRAEQDRRVAERRGRPTRKRDRSHGDQHDSRDERDRRHFRQD
jgi:hypothetical protein